MSDIAAKLNITVGSLTTSMNSLVKKGYATRERSEQDRRVVFIHLTLKGRKAYHHHAEFHRKMTDAVLDVLDEKEALVLRGNSFSPSLVRVTVCPIRSNRGMDSSFSNCLI